MVTETAKIRDIAKDFLHGEKGIDIGYGGEKILPHAIAFDMFIPGTNVGIDSQDGFGDARRLPYPSQSFDWVYSSHMLEHIEETTDTLKEWFRVLKPGGIMFLYLPIESKYREYCADVGVPRNYSHKVNMSIPLLEASAKSINAKILKIGEHAEYSFMAVLEKTDDTHVNHVAAAHSGDLGDIIYSIPVLKQAGVETLYINLVHPLKPRMLAPADVMFLKPLFLSLGIDMYIYNGESVAWDMDAYRMTHVEKAAMHISLSQAKQQKIDVDLSAKYIDVEPHHEYKNIKPVVIHRSSRYHNNEFNWEYLLYNAPRIVFVGLESEYELFKQQTGVVPEYHKVNSALEMARVIRSASVFVGNQSFPFAVAEAMKVRRIQETCPWVPNAIPQSWNGMAVKSQKQLQEASKWLERLVERSRLLS